MATNYGDAEGPDEEAGQGDLLEHLQVSERASQCCMHPIHGYDASEEEPGVWHNAKPGTTLPTCGQGCPSSKSL